MVKLVRPVNLFIVGITMMLFWFFLIQPVFFQNNISPLLDQSLFTLLMLMTLLVAAAGYVINDLQDVATDQINKPTSTVIGNSISFKTARQLYFGLNALALIIATFIVNKTQSFNVLGLCAMCILVLWFYSKYFKSTILLGNVVVSLLIALIPFIFIIVESDSFNLLFETNQDAYLSAYSTIISFTIFAFLTNLIREINKDCEDKEGDEASGILTFATALGYKKADLVSQTFTVFLFIAAIIWLLLKNIPSNIVELTVYLFIVLFPIIFLYWTLTNQERNKAKYTSVSNNLKLIMVLGLIYLLVHLNMNYA